MSSLLSFRTGLGLLQMYTRLELDGDEFVKVARPILLRLKTAAEPLDITSKTNLLEAMELLESLFAAFEGSKNGDAAYQESYHTYDARAQNACGAFCVSFLGVFAGAE